MNRAKKGKTNKGDGIELRNYFMKITYLMFMPAAI